MALYHYTAIDKQGNYQPGTIDAPSESEARRHLIEEQGLEPIAIAEHKEAKDVLAFLKTIKLETLVYFTRQLATMLTAGVEVLETLKALEDQEEDDKFREIIKQLGVKVEGGKPLSEGFAEHPEVFNRLYIAMVQAGEEAGKLPSALNELAMELEKQNKLKKAIKSAMIYPKIIVIITFLIVSGLLLTIVPQFAEIYKDLAEQSKPEPGQPKQSAELPALTRVVLKASEVLYPPGDKNLGWFIEVLIRFVGAFIFIFIMRRVVRKILTKPLPRAKWDNYKLNAPLKFGPLIQKIIVARFARTFSSLLKSGIPAVEAMRIVADSSGNVIVADAILKAQDKMLAGGTIAEPLERSGVFPIVVTRMIHTGEATGELAEMLEKIADYFEEEVDLQINGLTKLIEPLMMLFIGSIIGVVIIAIYMPMVGLYSKVGG
jgi:type IV pilus assembly protein PilC